MGKTGSDHVETVHDTVRRQQVEVERVPSVPALANPSVNGPRQGGSTTDLPERNPVTGRNTPASGLGTLARDADMQIRAGWGY